MDLIEMKKLENILNETKVEREEALHKSQKELEKVDKRKEPKTYADIEKEIEARKNEIKSVDEYIQKYTKISERISEINMQDLLKEQKEKREKLEKAEKKLEGIDKRKDPKTYAEGENEVLVRKEELDKIDKKVTIANKELDEIKKQLEEIMEKYHIKKPKKDRDSNSQDIKPEQKKDKDIKLEQLRSQLDSKKEELKTLRKNIISNRDEMNIEQKNKILELKDDVKKLRQQISDMENNRSKTEKYQKPMATQNEIDRYIALINQGYSIDSKEMVDFFKQIAKERALKIKESKENKNATDTTKSTKEERDENGNLKYPPILKEESGERESDGNLKYPPVEQTSKNQNLSSNDKGKKLSITYCGNDNQYIVSNYEEIIANASFENEDEKLKYLKDITKIFSKPIKAINFKNKKAKLKFLENDFDKDEIKYIFGNKKNMKKVAKTLDAQLVSILASLDVDYAKKYVHELSKEKKDKKEKLPYDMKYNLKGMKKNHKENGMSLFQRIRTNIMAKRNNKKGVAEYVPDDKNRKWLIFPVVGALAAGGLAIANHDKEQGYQKTYPTPKITGTTTPDKTIPENTTKPTETEPTHENLNGISDIGKAIEQAVEDAMNNKQEDNKDDLYLGSRVTLQEGLTYAENSLGEGVIGEIGKVSWRPAGDYTIDRVAIYYNGTLLENLSTEGINVDEAVRKYASQLGVDASEIVQNAHICVGDKHNGATGWLNMEQISIQDLKNSISKTYDELQKEKTTNQEQKNQSTNQVQSHEDR